MKLKLTLLKLGSLLASIVPIGIVLIVKRDAYFGTVSEGVKLGFGAVIGGALIAVSIFGKLKIPSSTVTLGVLTGLAFLLQSILPDLLLILGMAFVGNVTDKITFSPAINTLKKRIDAGINADATATAMVAVVQKLSGRA